MHAVAVGPEGRIFALDRSGCRVTVFRTSDLVRITFSTKDIPHSFTVDRYRIAKRVEPGKSVVFEFRADQPGRFPIY